jgi:hypothetical protein
LSDQRIVKLSCGSRFVLALSGSPCSRKLRLSTSLITECSVVTGQLFGWGTLPTQVDIAATPVLLNHQPQLVGRRICSAAAGLFHFAALLGLCTTRLSFLACG